MENVRKHRDIKLVTTERRRNYLVSEPNYHTTMLFTENLLAINKKVIGYIRDKLGGKIMKNFIGLVEKTYSYLIDDGSEDKKAKGTKKCFIKKKITFSNYKNCLEATQLDNKINYPEKNETNIDIFFVTKESIKNS